MLCVNFVCDEAARGWKWCVQYRPDWSASHQLCERACRALASMLDAFTDWHDETTAKETP